MSLKERKTKSADISSKENIGSGNLDLSKVIENGPVL